MVTTSEADSGVAPIFVAHFGVDQVRRGGRRSKARNSGGPAFPVHAHMLVYACGYALANAGHDTRCIQDWLGHRSIQHTTR